jgi:hypothetical protein
MGWSFGFKLHLIINHLGEIVSLKITTGNENDRKPVLDMADGIFGKLYGDKGYISAALTGELLDKGVELITTIRKNMKKKFISLRTYALTVNTWCALSSLRIFHSTVVHLMCLFGRFFKQILHLTGFCEIILDLKISVKSLIYNRLILSMRKSYHYGIEHF